MGFAPSLLLTVLVIAQTDEAKVAFDRGLAAFDAGRYEEAAKDFERSLAIRDAPSVWFNLALTYYRLHRYDLAARALDRQPERTPQIEQMMQDLKSKVAVVEIRPAQPGVKVFVDGIETSGRTYLLEGEHSIEARLPQHQPGRQTLSAVPGSEQKIQIAAGAQLPGMLWVKTTPSGAQVSIDGRPAGTGSFEGELPAGEHEVEATAAGFDPERRTVTLAADQRLDLTIELSEASDPIYAQWWFWTAIVVAAAGTAVAIGVGTRPSFDGGNYGKTLIGGEQ